MVVTEVMGIKEAVEATLRVLNHVEVRGRDSIMAMSIVIGNLENIVNAYKKPKEGAEENDADDRQGQDV